MNPLTTLTNQVKKTIKRTIQLKVSSIEQLSDNIKRITFEDISKTLLPEHESGYLKLQFRQSADTHYQADVVLRSYTILAVTNHQVIIDFVIHDEGIGTNWAKNAQVGDELSAIGPGDAKLVDTAFDWFILMGDLTALPAITVNLKTLPNDAKGYAIIEVRDETDIQELEKPAGIEIQWLVNQHSADSAELMRLSIEDKAWLEGTPYIWVASEFDSARGLRQYFKQQRQANKSHFYVSSYWKIGVSDEGNKKAKKMDGGF